MKIEVVQVNLAIKVHRSRETTAHISSASWEWRARVGGISQRVEGREGDSERKERLGDISKRS